MTRDELEKREEHAIDALTASFYGASPEDESDPLDDPSLLDDSDRRALAALGKDLVERLLSGQLGGIADSKSPIPGWDSPGAFSLPPEITALNRGDDKLTPEAIEELERHRRELLDDEFDDCEE